MVDKTRENMANLLKKDRDVVKPVHPEKTQPPQSTNTALTDKGHSGKNVKRGRKASLNTTVNFRCSIADINLVEKKITKLNQKGLGLDFKLVLQLLVKSASQLTGKELEEIIVKMRLQD